MCAFLAIMATASSVLVGVSASAQATKPERPAEYSALLSCRATSGAAERLACFDRRIAEMEAAEGRKEFVIVDRDRIAKTRRSVFGLSLPDLGIFGDGDSADEPAAKIEGTIRRTWTSADGRWNFEIDDGARWVQIDSRNLNIDPRPGHNIVIRRAAMGSYLASVNRQTAIRVRRLQ